MLVRYVNKIEGHSVVAFLAKAWVYLINEKLWDPRNILLSSELQCVYAVEDKKIIGAITFFVEEEEQCSNINLAYVHPAHRRKGVLTRLWSEMTERSKEQGATWVSNVCYPHNAGIAEFCKSVGGYAYTHQYRVDIKSP